MAFGIESFKSMEIPVPEDENIWLVPRTLFWTGEWKDAILVFTHKGIHFRVRKDKMIMVDRSGGAMDHSLLENSFLAFNRMKSYQQGSLLWKNSMIIEMVDGLSLRFGFHKDMETVKRILWDNVRPDMPRDLQPYDYSSHHPENGPHRMIPVGR